MNLVKYLYLNFFQVYWSPSTIGSTKKHVVRLINVYVMKIRLLYLKLAMATLWVHKIYKYQFTVNSKFIDICHQNIHLSIKIPEYAKYNLIHLILCYTKRIYNAVCYVHD